MELHYDKSSRTPVERAFYESFIMHDRWSVTRLYALNMSASITFKNELKYLGHQRKLNLLRLDNEIERTRKQLDKLQTLNLPTKKQESLLLKFPNKVMTNKTSIATDNENLRKNGVGGTKGSRKFLHIPQKIKTNLKETNAKLRYR